MKSIKTFLTIVILACLTSTAALADGDSMGGGGKTAPISNTVTN